MSIPFACPFCELETLVDDEYVGHSGPCANCGKQITVPYIVEEAPLQQDEVVVGIPYRPRAVATLVFVVLGGLIVGAGVLLVLFTLFIPAVGNLQQVARERTCAGNLQKIAEALLAYEEDYGALPPAYISDVHGNPMHSWRVMILPYLDERGLYEDYDFAEPWDSAHNKTLQGRMPPVFACPADPDARALGESNYMVVVGKGTLFPGAQARRTTDILDDRVTTIMVVETPVQGRPWLEPYDLDIESMQFAINGDYGTEISSLHEGGAQVVTAGGQVHFLDDMISSDYVEGMLSVDGGEAIPPERLEQRIRRW